jgi:hypothetical protein
MLIFWTLSIVLVFLNENVSETGSVSVLRWREGSYFGESLEKASLFHWTLSFYSPEDGDRSSL